MANSRDDLEKKLTALEKKAVAGAVKATSKQSDEGTLTAAMRGPVRCSTQTVTQTLRYT